MKCYCDKNFDRNDPYAIGYAEYVCPSGHMWFRIKNNKITEYLFFTDQNDTTYKISSFTIINRKGKISNLTSLAKFADREYQIILQVPKIEISFEKDQIPLDKIFNKLKTYLVFS